METKANFFLNGILVLLVLAGVAGFLHWVQTGSVTGIHATYRLVFPGSVGGLAKGGDVEFNGVKVGEVSDLRLDPQDSRRVETLITVDSSVPIRTDTGVLLRFGTVTGVGWIELRGGDANAERLAKAADGIPTMLTSERALAGVSAAAREFGQHFDALVGENSALQHSLNNFEAFTAALKQHSDRLDRVLVGFEGLAGSSDKPGELTAAVKSIRLLGDNLGKRIDELSPGITQFTGSGLKNIDALMVDVHRAVLTAERVFKNIGDNPSRVIFGGPPAQAPPAQAAPPPPRQPAPAQ